MKHRTRVLNFFFSSFVSWMFAFSFMNIKSENKLHMSINYLDKIGNEIKYNEIRCEQNKKYRQMCANQI